MFRSFCCQLIWRWATSSWYVPGSRLGKLRCASHGHRPVRPRVDFDVKVNRLYRVSQSPLKYTQTNSNSLEIGTAAVLLQLRIFGTLQQIHLIPASQLLPSLSYFVPFSYKSLIRWPGLIGFKPFMTHALLDTVIPLALMLGYVKLRNELTAMIYAPIYHRLPRPVNPDQPRLSINQSSDAPPVDEAEELPSPLRRQETIDSVAGRDNHDEENETRLGFEFEETTEVQAGAESWSAELRSAEPPKVVYHITTLTMLPPLLAADAMSLAISEVIVFPLEAIMVRVLAWTFQARSGGVTATMWPRFSFSWRSLSNVVIVHVAEVAVLAVAWAAFNAFSDWLGGVDEDDDEDLSGGEDKSNQAFS